MNPENDSEPIIEEAPSDKPEEHLYRVTEDGKLEPTGDTAPPKFEEDIDFDG